jgi:raffinose/stachyose/melibiose transport system permease protein
MLVSRSDRITTCVVLGVAALLTTLPILGIVLLSLHETNEQVAGFELPDRPHFETYKTAWTTARFSTFMWNSAKISLIVVVLTVVISVLSGYAFGTMRFRGANALFNVLLFGMIVPYEALVVPLYHDLKWANLVNTQWSVILPLLGTNVAFGSYWMRAYFRTVPKSLIEAAAIDGAGSFRTLWKVLLPGGRPAVLTLTVLVFMWSWNEFLLPLIMLSSDDLRTAPLGLPYFSTRYSTDRVGLAAAAVMVALPIVVVFVALQRSFVRGMTAGAVKE